jgi:hypothetical protein
MNTMREGQILTDFKKSFCSRLVFIKGNLSALLNLNRKIIFFFQNFHKLYKIGQNFETLTTMREGQMLTDFKNSFCSHLAFTKGNFSALLRFDQKTFIFFGPP